MVMISLFHTKKEEEEKITGKRHMIVDGNVSFLLRHH